VRRSRPGLTLRTPAPLRVYLGGFTAPYKLLKVLDDRLEQLEKQIQDLAWGRRRSHELGLDEEERLRYGNAIGDHLLRATHFEYGNVRRLRDGIADHDPEHPDSGLSTLVEVINNDSDCKDSLTSIREASVRSTDRAVRLVLGALAGLALVLVTALPTSAATTTTATTSSTTATWTLIDYLQGMCVTSDFGHPGAYFLVQIHGSWSSAITFGIRDLPPGSTTPAVAPIPPGSHSGSNVLRLVPAAIAPAPVGVYTAEIWATDGTVEQTVPVTIRVQTNCYS